MRNSKKQARPKKIRKAVVLGVSRFPPGPIGKWKKQRPNLKKGNAPAGYKSHHDWKVKLPGGQRRKKKKQGRELPLSEKGSNRRKRVLRTSGPIRNRRKKKRQVQAGSVGMRKKGDSCDRQGQFPKVWVKRKKTIRENFGGDRCLTCMRLRGTKERSHGKRGRGKRGLPKRRNAAECTCAPVRTDAGRTNKKTEGGEGSPDKGKNGGVPKFKKGRPDNSRKDGDDEYPGGGQLVAEGFSNSG